MSEHRRRISPARASNKKVDDSIHEIDKFAEYDHDRKTLMNEICQLRDEVQRLWLLCESLELYPEPPRDDTFLSIDEWLNGNELEPHDENSVSLLHSPQSGNYDWLVDLVFPKTGLGDVTEDNYSAALQPATIDPKLCFYNPSSAGVGEVRTGFFQQIDNTTRTFEEDCMDVTESYGPRGTVQNSVGSGAIADEKEDAPTTAGCKSIPFGSTPLNKSEDAEVSPNDKTNLGIISTGQFVCNVKLKGNASTICGKTFVRQCDLK